MRATIVSETTSQPSKFLDQNGNPQFQDTCKVNFEGLGEFNVNLNKPTIECLIDSMGEDSKSWMNQELTVEVERTRVAGRAGISLFMIPTGYQKIDNKDGFAEIVAKQLDLPKE